MANPVLVIFKKLLSKKGGPTSIKAADLDRNFQACTLLDGQGYTVKYTSEGMIIQFTTSSPHGG
jgi:hypothetical protein